MFYHADGVGKGIEAFKWYTKSAEQGFAPAQFNLGYMHRYNLAHNLAYKDDHKEFQVVN